MRPAAFYYFICSQIKIEFYDTEIKTVLYVDMLIPYMSKNISFFLKRTKKMK